MINAYQGQVFAPFPRHPSEATAGSASTPHPADVAHAPRCTSRSGALSWNLRSNGSRALQTPGREELTWEVRECSGHLQLFLGDLDMY